MANTNKINDLESALAAAMLRSTDAVGRKEADKLAQELEEATKPSENLFAVGRNVNFALPLGVTCLRPTFAGIKQAAFKLGISQAQAVRALAAYNAY